MAKRSQKPTKNEKLLRVDTVYQMLCDGTSRYNIIRNCSELWEVGERTADNYIAEARVQIEKDCALTRQQFLAEALDRLRTYEIAAAKRGQMQVATNSVRLQAELIGLTGKQ